LSDANKHFLACGKIWLMFHMFFSHIRQTYKTLRIWIIPLVRLWLSNFV
jgi:hypothetical protein